MTSNDDTPVTLPDATWASWGGGWELRLPVTEAHARAALGQPVTVVTRAGKRVQATVGPVLHAHEDATVVRNGLGGSGGSGGVGRCEDIYCDTLGTLYEAVDESGIPGMVCIHHDGPEDVCFG